jgi:hypothetical protein
MNRVAYFLAQPGDGRDLLPQNVGGGGLPDPSDSLIILGFIVVLAIVLFCWAYFLRKRPTEHQGAHVLVRSKRRHASPTPGPANASRNDRDASSRGLRVRRRRKRREEKLHRNPTLADTGGLPPLRPDDSEPGGTSTAQSVS